MLLLRRKGGKRAKTVEKGDLHVLANGKAEKNHVKKKAKKNKTDAVSVVPGAA